MDRAVCGAWGGALGGLTMSEDGGLDDVEEFFRAWASCCCRWARLACNASIWARCASSCSCRRLQPGQEVAAASRSEEHTSELQSLRHLVCRLLLEKKKKS